MNKIRNLCFSTAITVLTLSLANADIAEAGDYEAVESNERSLLQGRTVKILPQSVVRSLKLDPIPQAQPLNIGTYWNCFEQSLGGFSDETVEICDLVLVVCTDDGEFCTAL